MATIVFDRTQRLHLGAERPAVHGLDLEIKDGEFMENMAFALKMAKVPTAEQGRRARRRSAYSV